MKTIPLSPRSVFLANLFLVSFCTHWAVAAPAPPPVKTLVHDLRAEDAGVRIRGADALGRFGPRAASAAAALVEALGDPEGEVRKHVVDALTEIGPPAFRALADGVRGDDAPKRLLAFDVLFRIASLWNYKPGPALKDISPTLIDCLRDEDSEIWSNAIRALGMLGEVASIPHLLKLLEKEKDIEVRADAILTCGLFGEAGKQAVPVLARIVVDEHDTKLDSGFSSMGGWYSSLGDRAAASLAAIGEPAAPTLARLVADVKLSPAIRCDVLRAIDMESQVSRTKFTAAIPVICKAVSDREEKVRSHAIRALRGIRFTDKGVLAALRTAMAGDKSSSVRISSASALYDFGQPAQVVLPTILQFLEDKDIRVCISACSALGGMPRAAPEAIPKLIPLISDADASLRLAAVDALRYTGPAIVTAVPALTLAANDPDPEVRRAAQGALKEAKRWTRKP